VLIRAQTAHWVRHADLAPTSKKWYEGTSAFLLRSGGGMDMLSVLANSTLSRIPLDERRVVIDMIFLQAATTKEQ
jgi:hypothetical protein